MLMAMLNDAIKALMTTPVGATASAPPPNRASTNDNAFRVEGSKGTRPCDPRRWLKNFNLAAETCSWVGDDRRLIRQFKVLTEAAAWGWVGRTESSYENATFHEVCAKFIAQFELSPLIRKVRLDGMRQNEDQCVQDFATQFSAVQACLEAAEELQISSFVAKLLPNIWIGCGICCRNAWRKPKALRCKWRAK